MRRSYDIVPAPATGGVLRDPGQRTRVKIVFSRAPKAVAQTNTDTDGQSRTNRCPWKSLFFVRVSPRPRL